MSTTLERSQTLASGPKCCLNTPNVPGPQTSCVMRTSTFTQMFSPGVTASRPAPRARIFSVNVCGDGMDRLSVGWTIYSIWRGRGLAAADGYALVLVNVLACYAEGVT